MFSWLKKNPTSKLESKIKAKYEESVRLQRNGKIKEYGEIMLEIQDLEKQLDQLKNG